MRVFTHTSALTLCLCLLFSFKTVSANNNVAVETAQKRNNSQHTIQLNLVDQNNVAIEHAVVSLVGQAVKKTSSNTQNTPAVMDQVNISYQPRVLVVQKDDWVDFPNSDDVRHHVYSFSKAKPFEIKMYKGSDANPIQFDKAGIVALGCNIHDNMVGFIFVADGNETYKSDNNGMITINANTSEILVWHELLNPNHAQGERLSIKITPHLNVQTVIVPLVYPKNETKPSIGFKNKFKRGG